MYSTCTKYVLSFLYSVLILLNVLDVLFIGRVILMIQLIRESSPELCKIYSITFTIWMKIWSFTLRFVLFMRKLYRIYSINRPGRSLNFWTLRVGAYLRLALIQGWALIKFSSFSASELCLFCNKTINYANNKTRRSNKARFL